MQGNYDFKDRLNSILNIGHPIIQAPMLGVTTPEMVAAVSEANCMGSLPIGGLDPERTLGLIRSVKMLTKKPFAVNIFVHDLLENIEEQVFLSMEELLAKIHRDNNIPFKSIPWRGVRFNHYSEQIPLLIKENIQAVSFTFGIPDAGTMDLLKRRNIKIIGTATSVEEAVLLQEI